MIKAKISVGKILKEHLYEGKKGKYLDIAFFENRDGPDQYGNHGFIVQEVSREARNAGAKGPIIGNWKDTDTYKPSGQNLQKPKPPAMPAGLDDDSDVPF